MCSPTGAGGSASHVTGPVSVLPSGSKRVSEVAEQALGATPLPGEPPIKRRRIVSLEGLPAQDSEPGSPLQEVVLRLEAAGVTHDSGRPFQEEDLRALLQWIKTLDVASEEEEGRPARPQGKYGEVFLCCLAQDGHGDYTTGFETLVEMLDAQGILTPSEIHQVLAGFRASTETLAEQKSGVIKQVRELSFRFLTRLSTLGLGGKRSSLPGFEQLCQDQDPEQLADLFYYLQQQSHQQNDALLRLRSIDFLSLWIYATYPGYTGCASARHRHILHSTLALMKGERLTPEQASQVLFAPHPSIHASQKRFLLQLLQTHEGDERIVQALAQEGLVYQHQRTLPPRFFVGTLLQVAQGHLTWQQVPAPCRRPAQHCFANAMLCAFSSPQWGSTLGEAHGHVVKVFEVLARCRSDLPTLHADLVRLYNASVEEANRGQGNQSLQLPFMELPAIRTVRIEQTDAPPPFPKGHKLAGSHGILSSEDRRKIKADMQQLQESGALEALRNRGVSTTLEGVKACLWAARGGFIRSSNPPSQTAICLVASLNQEYTEGFQAIVLMLFEHGLLEAESFRRLLDFFELSREHLAEKKCLPSLSKDFSLSFWRALPIVSFGRKYPLSPTLNAHRRSLEIEPQEEIQAILRSYNMQASTALVHLFWTVATSVEPIPVHNWMFRPEWHRAAHVLLEHGVLNEDQVVRLCYDPEGSCNEQQRHFLSLLIARNRVYEDLAAQLEAYKVEFLPDRNVPIRLADFLGTLIQVGEGLLTWEEVPFPMLCPQATSLADLILEALVEKGRPVLDEDEEGATAASKQLWIRGFACFLAILDQMMTHTGESAGGEARLSDHKIPQDIVGRMAQQYNTQAVRHNRAIISAKEEQRLPVIGPISWRSSPQHLEGAGASPVSAAPVAEIRKTSLEEHHSPASPR